MSENELVCTVRVRTAQQSCPVIARWGTLRTAMGIILVQSRASMRREASTRLESMLILIDGIDGSADLTNQRLRTTDVPAYTPRLLLLWSRRISNF